MIRHLTLTAAALTVGTVAYADGHATGDAAAGEGAFRQCITCHVVQNDAGELLAGRGRANQQAPNLYAVAGRQAGTVGEYPRYSDSMVAAGEAGLMWDEDSFVAYTMDPTGFLREYLDDSGARGAMAFRVRDEQQARDLYAYLVSLAE